MHDRRESERAVADTGDLYRDLRGVLVRYLQTLGAREPEDEAQEALLRVVRRQRGGVQILDLRRYAVGVAHRVHQEALREPAFVALSENLPDHDRASGESAEWLDRCLTQALRTAPRESRELLLAYYGADGAQRIAGRRKLAETIGVTRLGLRLRVLRVKEGVAKTVKDLMGVVKQIG